MVGCLRKRVLLLWQAVQLSRNGERPNLHTLQVNAAVWLMSPACTSAQLTKEDFLHRNTPHSIPHSDVPQIARKALEPPDMLEEEGDTQGIAPMSRLTSIASPQYWSSVRCGCIEGILATAIYTSQHTDVWEAASMLLREHYRSVALDSFSNSETSRVQEELETWLNDVCTSSL